MSLRRIVLRDFVIVASLDLDLQSGFTVLTGETGAGKSILIDALQLVTGGRADVGLIREGARQTEVCAEFDTDDAVLAWLEDAGFAVDGGLLLRRTLDVQGRSRAWINGSPSTATQLRSLGERLLDIHGQHAWQSLTRADTARALLDAYAGLKTEAVAAAWRRWRDARDRLDEARASQERLLTERERLAWQIGELDKLAPTDGEWTELNVEHKRLSHAQALIDAAQGALALLDDDDDSACRRVGQAVDGLQRQVAIEPAFAALCNDLNAGLVQLEDSARALRAYLRHTELDPQRLGALDERLGSWLSLARRYRRQPEELPALLVGWREQLQTLDASVDLPALETALQAAWQDYAGQAQSLSHARRRTAPRLAKAITAAMQGLGMQGGQFEVQLETSAQPTQTGQDEVAFLVAGHPGSSPRPIQKVASGGELSRIALAIAVTTSRLGSAQTLIFDEVDVGIGGAVAETVGRLMRQLGRDRQVLAVTHLPQVAACADHHAVVSKQRTAQATLSSVSHLDREQRVNELARMLGGERLMDSTLAHARDLLTNQEDGYDRA